ncbi:MAG: hypothetical protein IKZ87_04270 [Actinomycetaceae bacterium]|nr:hypothetical protein [Actinomycetaceae bacterium]
MNTIIKILDTKRSWLILAFLVSILLLVLPTPSFAQASGVAGMAHALAELVVFLWDSIRKIIAIASTTIMALQMYTEQQLSVIKLNVKAEGLEAQVFAQAQADTAEAMANAYAATRKQENTIESFLKFNPVTGQGFRPCQQLAQARVMQDGVNSMLTNAEKDADQRPNAPGQLTNQANYDKNTLEEHYKYFCTEDDKKNDLCQTVSELPNGDMQSALLHDRIDTDLKKLATSKYIEYVIGRPTGAIRKDAAGSVELDTLYNLKNSSDSFLSIASHTLGMIRSANLVQDELGGKSPNELISERVGTYFGGEDSLEWTKTMAVQNPRGLILEAVKMEGLSTWLRYQQYKQMQNMELNLAALLFHDTRNDRDTLDTAVDQANAVSASGTKESTNE